MNWFIHSLKNYANFSGRANRREWWIFWFFYCLPAVMLISFALITPKHFFADDSDFFISLVLFVFGLFIIFAFLWYLFLLVPLLAVTIRRFHDIGLSGWWWFLTLIPIVGGIFLLVCLLVRGKPETNAYGEHPLSWADQKLRDLERKLLDKQLKPKADEFLKQLTDFLGKDSSPEQLAQEQKEMVRRFYVEWYPEQYLAQLRKKTVTLVKPLSIFLFDATLILFVLSAVFGILAGALAATGVETPAIAKLVGELHDVLRHLGYAAATAFILCMFPSMLDSSKILRAASRWEAKQKHKKLLRDARLKYLLDNPEGDFFADVEFPAVKDSLRSSRAANKAEVKLAALECVKERIAEA
jgi:uncharacterized membrane protein YhaH (DUF805 family)